jgi:hypothetical protein
MKDITLHISLMLCKKDLRQASFLLTKVLLTRRWRFVLSYSLFSVAIRSFHVFDRVILHCLH